MKKWGNEEMRKSMEKHLKAVSIIDLNSLASTLHPDGKMQLILPSEELSVSVDSFLSFHRTWFKDSLWTIDSEILNTQIGDQLGMAVIESVYREPERNGKPYFNRMIVSYLLEKKRTSGTSSKIMLPPPKREKFT